MRIRRLLLLAVVVASGACAQKSLPASFAELQPKLPPGSRAYITQQNGDEVNGVVDTLASDVLRLRLDESRSQSLAEADVAEIAVRDRYWPTMLIGAGTGALVWNVLGEEGCTAPNAVPGCRPVSRAEGTAVFAGIGAGLGFLIDFFKKETVYEGRPARQSATRVGPMVGKGRVGLVLSKTF